MSTAGWILFAATMAAAVTLSLIVSSLRGRPVHRLTDWLATPRSLRGTR